MLTLIYIILHGHCMTLHIYNVLQYHTLPHRMQARVDTDKYITQHHVTLPTLHILKDMHVLPCMSSDMYVCMCDANAQLVSLKCFFIRLVCHSET